MIGVASNAILRRGRLPFVGSRNEAVLPAVPSLPQQEAGARPPKWQVSESNTSVIRASITRSAHGESAGSFKGRENFVICAPIDQRANVKFRRSHTELKRILSALRSLIARERVRVLF